MICLRKQPSSSRAKGYRKIDPHDTQCIADALVRIDKEPGLAQELSRLGLRRAQELKWQDFAAGNLDVYRRVLQVS